MAIVKISKDGCKGCRLCMQVCPKNIITIGEELNVQGVFPCISLEADKCIGCLRCTAMCPDAIIEIIEEKE